MTNLDALVAEAMAAVKAMTPEQQAEMWRKQRESFIRAMAPCEHGDPDWETCPDCLQSYTDARATKPIEGTGNE